MKFGDELDKYVVLKLPLDKYKGATRALEAGFKIAGYEARKRIRNDEKRLLKSYFHNWAAPYYGNLKGWREDSPIYVLYQGKLVSGLYLCDENGFDEEENYGQLHYFFTDPLFRGRGLHSILVREAMYRARLWGLRGVIINTDRYLLPEVYIRGGAIPWKEIMKKKPSGMTLTSAMKFVRSMERAVRAFIRRLW